MWATLVERAAVAGWHALAPDLPGYGDSPPDPPHTWQRMVDAVERFHGERAAGPVALCVHDWGGLIGLRWACDHPDAVSALVISNTGFFPDGRWHGMAQSLRKPGTGEALIDGLTREAFVSLMESTMPGGFDEETVDQYWKCYGDADRRAAHLELY